MEYDIIVIGGGIAGLTAAIYARRAGKTVLVLEKTALGGQILETHHIENYPGAPKIDGPDLAALAISQAKELGADFKTETVTSISRPAPKTTKEKTLGGKHLSISLYQFTESSPFCWEVTTDMGTSYLTSAIIFATGTTYRTLGLPHEAELLGHGLSYCATCDGALYKNRPVAVYGGGNSALYSALYLSDIASKVYLIHRRNELRADSALIKKVEDRKNVEFILDTTISELLQTGSSLSGVKLANGQTLELFGLFVSIGREPSIKDLIKNNEALEDIELDKNGYILTDEDCQTDAEGIFAAGDCRSKNLRQIITAASDGALAASSAVKALGIED